MRYNSPFALTSVPEADQEPNQEPGDIVFQLSEKEHPTFVRAGGDLSADLNITLAEALTGFSRVVLTHLDGRGLRMKIDPKTKILRPDQILQVAGEGMPVKRSDLRGDLFLCVKIKFPEDGYFKQDGTLEKLAQILPKPETPIKSKEVDEIDFEEGDIEHFGAGSSDPRAADADWEDEDDMPQAQCAQQ